MFAVAFPPAALFSLLNNVVEMTSDAAKLLYSHRRPRPLGAKSIGIFQDVLSLLGYLAVLVNALIIAFVSSTLSNIWERTGATFSAGPYSGVDNKFRKALWAFVVVVLGEHLLIGLKLLIEAAVPDTPRWVQVNDARSRREGQIIERAKRIREKKSNLKEIKKKEHRAKMAQEQDEKIIARGGVAE